MKLYPLKRSPRSILITFFIRAASDSRRCTWNGSATIPEIWGCPFWLSTSWDCASPLNSIVMAMTVLAKGKAIDCGNSSPSFKTRRNVCYLEMPLSVVLPEGRRLNKPITNSLFRSWMIFFFFFFLTTESLKEEPSFTSAFPDWNISLGLLLEPDKKTHRVSPGRAIFFLVLFTDSAGTLTDFLKIKTKTSAWLTFKRQGLRFQSFA